MNVRMTDTVIDDPRKCVCRGRGEYFVIPEMSALMRDLLTSEGLLGVLNGRRVHVTKAVCLLHSRQISEHDRRMLSEMGIA